MIADTLQDLKILQGVILWISPKRKHPPPLFAEGEASYYPRIRRFLAMLIGPSCMVLIQARLLPQP